MSEAGWADGADERLTEVIGDVLGDSMPMVRDWVLVVTYVDDEGNDATAFNSHPDSRRTSTLGMLTHAMEVQRAYIFWGEKPDD